MCYVCSNQLNELIMFYLFFLDSLNRFHASKCYSSVIGESHVDSFALACQKRFGYTGACVIQLRNVKHLNKSIAGFKRSQGFRSI